MKIEISNRLLILLVIFIILAISTFLTYLKPAIVPNPPAQATSAPSNVNTVNIQITDAKMTTGLDDQLMPIEVMDVFPRNTKRVYCWFSWDNAIPKTEMKAEWHYTVDDVHIFTYNFRIPKAKGSGGISLIMPEGKTLPIGTYRIDLIAENQILRSVTFKVK